MSEILLLNSRARVGRKKRAKPKRRSTAKRKTVKRRTTTARKNPVARRVAKRKGAVTMAKRRKRKTTTTRRAPRRNPSRARRARRSISRRASSSIAGLNFKSALKGIPLNTLGMFAAKWAAKRFGDAASETDPESWNYASYLKGAAGAAAAGFVANMIKRGSGQRVLEGGMSLMLYKLIQNELIAGNEFWSGQLGAGEGRYPGVVEENSAGEPYILGEDYEWYPLEGADDYRMDPDLLGSSLVQPGPLGDSLIEPGPLGATAVQDAYARSFLRR